MMWIEIGVLLFSIFPQIENADMGNGDRLPFEIMDGILHDENYNKKLRPHEREGKPTVVRCNFVLTTISEVDEINMDYKITIYFRQFWEDPRLRYNSSNPDQVVTLNTLHQYKDMWVPDTFFSNEKDSYLHGVTLPNRMIQIRPDGSITYSQRVSMVLTCTFHLQKFPLDNQTCWVKLESYSYRVEEITLLWREKAPVEIPLYRMSLPEFKIVNVTTESCTHAYTTGTFPCLRAAIMLERQWAYYLIQTFIPTVLIVILSWLSFWIDKDAVPARISLGIMTVLTITTQSSSIGERLPRVSYIKGMDIWMTTSVFFVFMALVEFSLVNLFSRNPHLSPFYMTSSQEDLPPDGNDRSKKYHSAGNDPSAENDTPHVTPRSTDDFIMEERVRRQTQLSRLSQQIPRMSLEVPRGPYKKPGRCLEWLHQFFQRYLTPDFAENIDIICRFLFPGLYFLFNVVYFLCKMLINVEATP